MSDLLDKARKLSQQAQQVHREAVLATLRTEMDFFFKGLEAEILHQAGKGFHNVRICISRSLWFELAADAAKNVIQLEFLQRLDTEFGILNHQFELEASDNRKANAAYYVVFKF